MDALADLLDDVRARSAAFCHVVLEPPWGLRIADGAPLALAAPLRGSAWIVPDDADPVELAEGDVAVVTGTEPYTVAHHPRTSPTVLVGPNNRLTTMTGEDASELLRHSVPGASNRHPEAGNARGATLLASGTYQMVGDLSGRLLAALPRVLRVPASSAAGPVMRLIAEEVDQVSPGQQIMLDRLLDAALIATLREWFALAGAGAPGWFRAQSDPVVGAALRGIHDDPARDWSVADLAGLAGASRATLSARFSALIGQPPMTYLTEWRIALAAEQLGRSDATIDVIARRVGYANAFALSVAFKRVRGITPRQYRLSSSRANC